MVLSHPRFAEVRRRRKLNDRFAELRKLCQSTKSQKPAILSCAIERILALQVRAPTHTAPSWQNRGIALWAKGFSLHPAYAAARGGMLEGGCGSAPGGCLLPLSTPALAGGDLSCSVHGAPCCACASVLPRMRRVTESGV